MKTALLVLGALALSASLSAQTADDPLAGYLFTYFGAMPGDGQRGEELRFAVSDDGYNYRALNGNRPVIASDTISQTGGIRDPHILRREDGKGFYMVATDMVAANGWDSNRAMVLMKSDNLTDWTSSVVNIQQTYPGQDSLKRVWAPQTIFDPVAQKYMLYWSMKYGSGPDVIYYAYANPDFTALEGEPKPFFIPEDKGACIDGDIVWHDGLYHLFYKTEGHGNGIKVATSPALLGEKWTEQPDYKQQTTADVEGAGVFKLIGQDKYILMYDVYRSKKYQFTESTDLRTFRAIDSEITMDFHPRHGTIIPVTASELARLRAKWGN